MCVCVSVRLCVCVSVCLCVCMCLCVYVGVAQHSARATNASTPQGEFNKALATIEAEGTAEAPAGSLTKEQFVATMQAVKLVGARGEDFSQPDRLEALFAAADVDGDGTVSLEELLRSFKPKDGSFNIYIYIDIYIYVYI